MGDRALVVIRDGDDVSPVIYLHWHGHMVAEWIAELKQLMKGREGDVSYAAARFVGICHNHIEGNMSLGIMGGQDELIENPAKASHGDHGVVIVNAQDFSFEQHGESSKLEGRSN